MNEDRVGGGQFGGNEAIKDDGDDGLGVGSVFFTRTLIRVALGTVCRYRQELCLHILIGVEQRSERGRIVRVDHDSGKAPGGELDKDGVVAGEAVGDVEPRLQRSADLFVIREGRLLLLARGERQSPRSHRRQRILQRHVDRPRLVTVVLHRNIDVPGVGLLQ